MNHRFSKSENCIVKLLWSGLKIPCLWHILHRVCDCTNHNSYNFIHTQNTPNQNLLKASSILFVQCIKHPFILLTITHIYACVKHAQFEWIFVLIFSWLEFNVPLQFWGISHNKYWKLSNISAVAIFRLIHINPHDGKCNVRQNTE